MKIATLNINGFGNLVKDHDDNKWGRTYKLMTDQRIAILLLQETHLTEERKASLHKMFAKRIKIFHSAHPEAPTQREGVAVVVNTRYLAAGGADATEIIPGRALQISVQCQGGYTRHILCVYTPTSDGVEERKQFFIQLREYYENHPTFPRPDAMAGDFNTVEDTIDRLPVHEGPDASLSALDDLKLTLGLMMADGWRATNPTLRDYTFHRGSGQNAVFSRLDRIYVTMELFNNSREWRISEAGVKTDHSLVSVQLTSDKAPVVGPGRPIFPLSLLKDKPLAKSLKKRGMDALRELEAIEASGVRSAEVNAQLVLHKFKVDAMLMARDRERAVVPKLLHEIQQAEQELRKVKANQRLSEEAVISEAAALTKQIRELKLRRFKQQQQNARATHRLYGERPTKYWSKLHKERAPRDVISAFEKNPERGPLVEAIYESDSVKMTEMARRHHNGVQRDDPEMKPPELRERDIQTALDSLEVRVSAEQCHELQSEITYKDCELSLRFSKNGSAPGMDGIPFELWKTLHARHVEDSHFTNREDFDVLKLMRAAFEDMRQHGVEVTTSFAEGWMAPIYKEKGERTKVANYRPITLLNTDYKILSKTLAIRLADVAPQLIHKAQAGFVPGRKIHNHTQLARMMMLWAEENRADGAIVALDQEKAYDKIAHDYLWKVLRQFGIPEVFVNLIQSLYAHANTSVMINGILSRPYQVYRGVRQGDPLSCLLFDLAIEPLSAMIRNSELKGFNIPRSGEVLKATLFADDTTVYLSSEDDFAVLQEILDTWCSATKAKFNLRKTEIIPIGTPNFRQTMAETYRSTGVWQNFPANVHVAQDGEPVRILGAFFGNNVSQVDVWSTVLTKMVAMRQPLMRAIERWQTGRATVVGKTHVVQMIIGGMTQYLTNVQRMPDAIVKRLTKVIRGYLWDNRHNTPVGMSHVQLPVEQGGLGLLDLHARNDAIDVMWLKSYLDFSSERPLWAYLADDLLANHVPKACRPTIPSLRINTFLQNWNPKMRGLPDELKAMLNVARKYGLRMEGLAFSRGIMRNMPMWDHSNASRKELGRLCYPSKVTTCLRQNHRAKTVGDFERLAEVLTMAGHRPSEECECAGCMYLEDSAACEHPHACCTRARDMLATLPGKWNPTMSQPEDYENELMSKLREELTDRDHVPFDRRITTYGDLGQAFRIFTGDSPVSNSGVSMEIEEDGSSLEVATDGSCTNNGDANARAGAGVFVGEGHALNKSIRLPASMEQSNQTGEAVATLTAASTPAKNTRVTHITDSKTVMDSLTRWRQKNEDSGYILQKNAPITQAIVAQLRMRKAHSIFRWVKGHEGHPGNEAADKLAAYGAMKSIGNEVSLTIPPQFALTGAKLPCITQKLAYKAIRARKAAKTKPRRRAETNLDMITSGVLDRFGVQVHNATVWKSLRSRHVSREAAQFMWLTIHDGFMVGTHWLRPKMSAELQQRATCATCGELETMTHILFDCPAKGQKTVWRLLKRVWGLTGEDWKRPCWGTALGAACAVFKAENGARRTDLESLWCILCTEVAHLIWKLRCERVIQHKGKEFTKSEITNRFYATLDARLTLDRRVAAMASSKRALKPDDVERIWMPVIDDSKELPPNWVVQSGVLVGIKRGR